MSVLTAELIAESGCVWHELRRKESVADYDTRIPQKFAPIVNKMQTINARFFQENSTAIHTTLGDNGYCAYLEV